MTRNTQASKWRHKVDKGRAATKAVEAVMAERRATRLVKTIRLGTRVRVRINPGRGSSWQCRLKVVARRATAMTMWCNLKVVADTSQTYL